MATASKRDVKLTVGVDVNGQDGLTDLAGGLRGVGEAAGQSTPSLDRMAAELDALAASTKSARDAEAASKAEAAKARAELNAQADALARLRAGSDAATRATEDFRTSETTLKVALTEARIALRDKNAAAAAAAAESKAAALAERELAASLQAARAAAAAAAREQAAANANVGETLKSLKGQLDALRNVATLALGGSLVGSLARDLGETADEYANLSARIRIATGDSGQFASTLQGVFDVAQRTGVAVGEVGALVTKLTQAGRELKLTSTDALALAESVSQATQLSGASAQEAAAAVTQFAQAIASGKLQGDELRSILENSPRLARALADGLGVTIGQLRDLGSAGALTSKEVIAALQGQSQVLKTEFDQLPPTVGRALTNLGSQWTRYVGEVDKATGASKTAAGAIASLSGNLDTLAAVLFSVGKAAAAYAALRLGQAFIDTATAARSATAAVEANTAATFANAAAQRLNGAAGAETVANVGRLAGLLSTLKLGVFLGVITNLREIGTAAGEGIAKLVGYKDASADIERTFKADEAAARANAAAVAAVAQQMQQASDKALGLTKEARALVGEFDDLVSKGNSAAESLSKIGKNLDLSNIKGIETASAALDALALKGKITSDQIRDALAAALKGEDLGVFEANARAAFDGSAQGARRLALAIDAIANESLARAGTSVDELRTGFSKAANSAINDVDALAAALTSLGVKGDESARALASALDKATSTANTTRALQAVADRVKALGEVGLLAGDQVAAALDKIARKADEIRPGINSLGEALHTFGLQTRTELQATADRLGAAYQQIANSTEVSIEDQIKAFGQFRDAAIAANKGVEPYQVTLQRHILESRADVAGLGDAFEAAMNRAKTATDAAAASLTKYNDLLKNDPTRLVGGDGLAGFGTNTKPNFSPTPSPAPAAPGGGQYTPPDSSPGWVFDVAAWQKAGGINGAFSNEAAKRFWYKGSGPGAALNGGQNGTSGSGAAPGSLVGIPTPAAVPAPVPSAAPSGTAGAPVSLTVNIGGKPYGIAAGSMKQAEQVIAALEAAYAAGGG